MCANCANCAKLLETALESPMLPKNPIVAQAVSSWPKLRQSCPSELPIRVVQTFETRIWKKDWNRQCCAKNPIVAQGVSSWPNHRYRSFSRVAHQSCPDILRLEFGKSPGIANVAQKIRLLLKVFHRGPTIVARASPELRIRVVQTF